MSRKPACEDSDFIQRRMAEENAWRRAADRKCGELPPAVQCDEPGCPICRPLDFKRQYQEPEPACLAIHADLGASMRLIGAANAPARGADRISTAWHKP